MKQFIKALMSKLLGLPIWASMDIAPKDKEILVLSANGGVCISKYTPNDVGGSGFGSIHSCCGYYEDVEPVAWKDIN